MKEGLALEIKNLSKQYRLGITGTGTISHDFNRWWHKVRGKEDPYALVGEENDRTVVGGDYVWALKDINLEVKQGEILGIIGKNGAGKSTLLKLLSKISGPTTGSISMRGRMAALLEVGTGFHEELTGRENIFLNGAILGMSKREISSKLDDIVDFSGCAKYVDTPVKRYSSGMRVRLGFAVAAFLEPDILVVDEVLAVGDAEFQKQAIGKMKDVSSKGGRTVLFVSHNMASVKTLCTRGVVMDKGKVSFDGGILDAVECYLEKGSDLIAQRNYEGNPDQPKTSIVEFVEYKLCSTNGNVINKFDVCDDVYVEMIYRVKDDTVKCLPNIHFFNKNEECYFVECVHSDSVPKEKGMYSTKFKLPANTFNVGVYSIGLAITVYPGSNVQFFINPAIIFEVIEGNLDLRGFPVTGLLPGISRLRLENETKKIVK